MSYKTAQGYVLVVLTGAILLAATVLIVLQWDNSSEFNLFGRSYTVHLVENDIVGGVNTALLILGSAAGGVILWWCLKVLFRSVRVISRGRREAKSREVSKRVEKLEKAGAEKSS